MPNSTRYFLIHLVYTLMQWLLMKFFHIFKDCTKKKYVAVYRNFKTVQVLKLREAPLFFIKTSIFCFQLLHYTFFNNEITFYDHC